jgi:flagellar biosynthetic protein FliP
VVLSLLRTAIGLSTAPPNSVMVSSRLFLTFFIMRPTLQAATTGHRAAARGHRSRSQEAFTRLGRRARLHGRQCRGGGSAALLRHSNTTSPPTRPTSIPLQIAVPAFMISELRRAFEIGFLLFLPFVIIDMVVASVLMSMGMMMLPPVVISLPFKLIFFVLVDGWHLSPARWCEAFGSHIARVRRALRLHLRRRPCPGAVA